MGMTIMETLFYGMWEIWKIRCTLKYDEGRFSAQALLRKVYTHVYDCTRFMQPKREPSNFQKICLEEVKCPILEVKIKRGTWVKWMPPDPREFKLKVDGSWKRGASGGGGLVRDHRGDFLFGFCAPYNSDDPMGAEIQAMHEGMTMCVAQ